VNFRGEARFLCHKGSAEQEEEDWEAQVTGRQAKVRKSDERNLGHPALESNEAEIHKI